MVAGGKRVYDNKPYMPAKLLNYAEQRNYGNKHKCAESYNNKARRENTSPAALIIKRKAENTVGNAERYYGEKQVCGLGYQVRRAVIRRRHIPGVKPHHEKNKYFRAECTYAYKQCV